MYLMMYVRIMFCLWLLLFFVRVARRAADGRPSCRTKVLEHFFAKYSLESPLRQYLLRQAERLQAEEEALKRELAPTLRLKETLDEQVRQRRDTINTRTPACRVL